MLENNELWAGRRGRNRVMAVKAVVTRGSGQNLPHPLLSPSVPLTSSLIKSKRKKPRGGEDLKKKKEIQINGERERERAPLTCIGRQCYKVLPRLMSRFDSVLINSPNLHCRVSVELGKQILKVVRQGQGLRAETSSRRVRWGSCPARCQACYRAAELASVGILVQSWTAGLTGHGGSLPRT